MGLTHGIQGSLVWTEGGGEGNAGIREVNCFKIVVRTQRRMAEVTPLNWNSQEWVPGQYRWTAEIHAYTEVGLESGFYNDTLATFAFKTNTAAGDQYAGSVWIEGIRIESETEAVSFVVFLVRGTGNLVWTT